MSGYAEYLKDLLRPLRVYELEGTANGGELEAQGQALDGVEAGLEEIQRGTHGPRLSFTDLGDPTDLDSTRQIRCNLYLLAPILLDPEQITGLELGGEWYEFPAE